MLVLVINGSDHPRGSLLSNCLLTLIVALLKKNIKKHKQIKTTNKQTKIIKKPNPNWNKTFQHNRFASHLETFKGISIYFLVNKNQVVLNDLLNCWAVSGNALDFFPLPERLCVLGGRAARLFFSIVRGKLAATFLSGVWCWGLLGGAVSHLQAGDHPGMGLAVYFQSLCTSGYL